jgi:tetratricopeptide (TPR) repeat protein
MKRLIFIIMILFVLSSAFAEDTGQRENVSGVSDKDNVAQKHINSGFDHIKNSEYQKAVKAFETAIELSPNNADAYVGLGTSYLKLGDNEVMTNTELVEKAVEASKEALRLGADYPEVHYTLGLSYLALKNKESAMEEYGILKRADDELAKQLLARIGDFKSPTSYIHIGTTGERWQPSIQSKCEPGEIYNTIFAKCYKVDESQASKPGKKETQKKNDENK